MTQKKQDELTIEKTFRIFSSQSMGPVKKLMGDVSTRRYYRVQNGKGTLVACIDPNRAPKKEQYPFFQVHRFLAKNGFRVPQILHYDLKTGVLLQEDLGDTTLLQHLAGVKTPKEEYTLYKTCVDILIQMQNTAIPAGKNLIFNHLYFDLEKFMFEINFTRIHFLEGFLKCRSGGRDVQTIGRHFEKICRELSSHHNVFAHRDFHSRNIMVKGKELVLIDFQDARMGNIAYDLVSLLEDCYYNLDEKNRLNLIDYYWEKKGRDITGPSKDVFLRLYALMSMQRLYKAIGSFSFVYHSKGDPKYLRHIGFAMEKLKKFLFQYPEWDPLRKTLFKIYYGH